MARRAQQAVSNGQSLSRSVLRPGRALSIRQSTVQGDLLTAGGIVGFVNACRAFLTTLPSVPPLTFPLVVTDPTHPELSYAIYIEGLICAFAFLTCFYAFTNRYLGRIFVPYFARSSGRSYVAWLFGYMLFVLIVIFLDPSFWWVGPALALICSMLWMWPRQLLVQRTITKALEAAPAAAVDVQIGDFQWRRDFLIAVVELGKSSLRRLTLLGFALGGVLTIPIIGSHLALVWWVRPDMTTIEGAHLRGIFVGIYGISSAMFTVIYVFVLLQRYLELTDEAADRMDDMDARTPS